MIYSNDEKDKSIRHRNYFLTIYIVPGALIAVLCGVIYWATINNFLEKTDSPVVYFLTLPPAFILYSYNRRNWLRMPDGTFYYIKEMVPLQNLGLNEPAEYEVEYFYSKTEKASTTFTGFAIIAVSIWLGFKSSNTILVPLITGTVGFIFSFFGLKGLFDRQAKLKIAKNGLWTRKLGFVSWDHVNFAEVVEEDSREYPSIFLEVRLKGTIYDEANQPDERLLLSDLKGKERIERVINNSITNYINLKMRTEADKEAN